MDLQTPNPETLNPQDVGQLACVAPLPEGWTEVAGGGAAGVKCYRSVVLVVM